ncbi:MAG: 4-hydroxy-tetrahydrodipicolinate reductase [Candidatus Hydrogenedentota bacterium]|nr:MAG: 4-hydroxy-tetrahydrodipicolinate reductase [Candidatus Hydrogenedentota bacterium]
MTRITVAGAGGRMGGRITALCAEDPAFLLVGAIEARGHPAVGRDAGLVAGCGELNVTVTAEIEKALEGAEVLVDFTAPGAVIQNVTAAREKGIGYVVGTTGLGERETTAIEEASMKIPIVAAPNMAVGVNLLFRIAPMIANALGEAYDIEILEMHHNKKKDAPSGTAMRLLREIQEARKGSAAEPIFGRRGMIGARPEGEIGVHAIRAGDIVGEHTVLFATGGERIELTHKASSRDTFARGALRAAAYLKNRPPGLYSMQDVLFPENPRS